jgi:hypothetical protein
MSLSVLLFENRRFRMYWSNLEYLTVSVATFDSSFRQNDFLSNPGIHAATLHRQVM